MLARMKKLPIDRIAFSAEVRDVYQHCGKVPPPH
jgi:hypothetical protein